MKALKLALVAVLLQTVFVPTVGAVLLEFAGANDSIAKASTEVNRTIAQARQMAETLIIRGDDAAKARLEQIDTIIDSALRSLAALESEIEQDILRILDKANADLARVKEDLFLRLRMLIWEIDCKSKVAGLEDLRHLLGNLADVFGTHKIQVELPIKRDTWNPLGGKRGTFKIRTPFGDTYIEVRDYLLKILDEELTEETPAHSIVGTYEYISVFALKAACFYPEVGTRWLDEHLKFKGKAESWNKLLAVEVRK